MFKGFQRFLKRRRLAYYRHLLKDQLPSHTESAIVAQRLAYLWRHIKPRDLIVISDAKLAVTVVECWSNSLWSLVDTLKRVNYCISIEEDMALENLLLLFQIRGEHTLDLFCSDEERYSIDVEYYLVRLSGLLQEHCHLVTQKENQYYQRMTAKLYQDIIELTEALVVLAYESLES